MIDHFWRYVVLAPLKEKSARAVAHAIVSKLICEYSAPRVLWSDNGAEFRNKVLAEICCQFGIKQTFTVAYHPASNGLVERSNRKILEILRPIVAGHLGTWEDWDPQVAATINASVCESTGQSPHYIVFGSPKRLPYDLLSSQQPPVYDPEDYTNIQLHNFSKIHCKVTQKLQSKSDMKTAKQYKCARPVSFSEGDAVMIAAPERQSKLSPKFSGPYTVTRVLGGNKYVVLDAEKGTSEVYHSDRLKPTRAAAQPEASATGLSPLAVPFVPAAVRPSAPAGSSSPPTHAYNLRSRS